MRVVAVSLFPDQHQLQQTQVEKAGLNDFKIAMPEKPVIIFKCRELPQTIGDIGMNGGIAMQEDPPEAAPSFEQAVLKPLQAGAV